MPKNTGDAAQNEFDAYVRRRGKRAYLHEFPDTRKIKGMLGVKGMTIAQPADRLVCLEGVLQFAEVKSTENAKRFPKSHIRKSQWATAVQVVAAGGPYFFYIRRETDKKWFRVPARFFVENEKPSWTWSELEIFQWNLS